MNERCWFCYWGWPKLVREVYEEAVQEINALGGDGESAMDYGPGHIVWSDENFEKCDVRWCIEQGRAGKNWHDDPEETDAVKAVVLRSLERLLELPDEMLSSPKDYDGEHPENYPPKVEMVRC